MLQFVLKSFLVLCMLCLMSSCVGQTFQYSRGWTNGKRSDTSETVTTKATTQTKTIAKVLNDKQVPLNLYGNLREATYDMQRNKLDRTFERCLIQLHHFLRNHFLTQSLQQPTYDFIDATNNVHHSNDNDNDNDNDNNRNNIYNNNDNPAYTKRHQSFDVYGKVGGNHDIDSSDDYMIH